MIREDPAQSPVGREVHGTFMALTPRVPPGRLRVSAEGCEGHDRGLVVKATVPESQ